MDSRPELRDGRDLGGESEQGSIASLCTPQLRTEVPLVQEFDIAWSRTSVRWTLIQNAITNMVGGLLLPAIDTAWYGGTVDNC